MTLIQAGVAAGLMICVATQAVLGDGPTSGPMGAPTTSPAAGFAWKKLNTEAYKGKQDDIFFSSPLCGWYVNGGGNIFHTADGGETWVKQIEKKGTFFRCIGFVDELHGFAGNIGTDYFPGVTDTTPLYETVDGGKTWAGVNIGGEAVKGLCSIQILKVAYINAGVLDYKVRILAGGRVGGPAGLVYSDDLGKTWEHVALPESCHMILDICFFDKEHGLLASASDGNVQDSHALILRTEDGGKTWVEAYKGPRAFELTWKMQFPTRETGYCTVQSYDPDPKVADRFVAKTVDGGKTWSEVPLVNDAKVREFGVGFVDETLGFVGAVPKGFVTTDGGKTWGTTEMGPAVNKIRVLKTEIGHTVYAIGVGVKKLEVMGDRDGSPGPKP